MDKDSVEGIKLSGAHDHVNTWLERRILKRRAVIFNSPIPKLCSEYPIRKITDVGGLAAFRDQFTGVQLKKFERRLDRECTGYFYVLDGQAAGMIWANHPSCETWFDCMPTMPGTARAVGTFVHPDYRGRGIAVALRQFLVNDMNSRGIRTVWGIAEFANERSQAYNKKVGIERIEVNWLVKFYGWNVLSIVDGRVFILWPARRGVM